VTDLCPTGKRVYRSKSDARNANQRNHKRLRVYLCDACRGWHVTQEANCYGRWTIARDEDEQDR
jgi:hypothetical protein